MKAERKNEGKPKLSMIALDCMEQCAKVLEFGAQKYSRDNWRKGMPQNEILDSLLRHISKIQKGEFIDEESGLSHIGHIQCNAMFLGNPNNTIEGPHCTKTEEIGGWTILDVKPGEDIRGIT